jgi:hypothetical protein
MAPDGIVTLLVTDWLDTRPARVVAASVSPLGAGWAGSPDWLVYAQRGALYLHGATQPAAYRLTPEDEWLIATPDAAGTG